MARRVCAWSATNFFETGEGSADYMQVGAGGQFAPINGQVLGAHEDGTVSPVWWDGSTLRSGG